MDLHRHTNHPVNQLQTLLKLQRLCLDELASDTNMALFESRVQHLRNACELVAAWAEGADDALSGVLLELSRAEASGMLSRATVERIVAPAADALGEQYLCEVMALPSDLA